MIVYVSTERFSTPAKRLRKGLPKDFRKLFRHLSYEELFFEGAGPIAHYILTDFDRITAFERDRLCDFVSALRDVAPDVKVLNDPTRVLERTALLAALHRHRINDFAVTRLDTGKRPKKYPVFIRSEDGYAGPETGLIHDDAEFDAAVATLMQNGKPLKGRISVGYAAERGADGYYRKYGAYNVGGDIFSYHLLRSRHWIIKRNFPLFDGSQSADDEVARTPEALAEELDFVREQPHLKQLRQVFDIAGIEFGRVDYGIVGGRVQVYEINTNPNAPSGRRHSRTLERRTIMRQRMFAALEKIEAPIAARGRIRLPAHRPHAHDQRLPRRRLLVSSLRKVADLFPPRPLTTRGIKS